MILENALLGRQLKLHPQRNLRVLENYTQERFRPRQGKIYFSAAVGRLHGVFGYEHHEQCAPVQMDRDILRPLHARTDPLVEPDPIAERSQLLYGRKNFFAVFVRITHKNIWLGAVVCGNH